MPGLAYISSKNNISDPNKWLKDTFVEEHFRSSTLYENVNSFLAITYYDGYPYKSWNYRDAIVVYEGLIYNLDFQFFETKVNQIIDAYLSGGDFKSLIKEIVESADGDFNIFIKLANGTCIVFNDYLGRLPLYYYFSHSRCVMSRDIKFILHAKEKIKIDKNSLVDYMLFEYPLGSRTLFEDISRLFPAKIIEFDTTKQKNEFRISDSTDFNFELSNPYLTKDQAIDELSSHYLKCVENRVSTLNNEGYKLISDLSGGFDSRTVLAGLSKFSNKVTYCSTNLATNTAGIDETLWAERIFNKMDSPGEINKFHNQYEISSNELSRLIYLTDCSANFQTANVCHTDIRTVRKAFQGKVARFSGYGGSDFIRKAPQVFYKSIFYCLKNGLFVRSLFTPEMMCKNMRYQFSSYLESIEEYSKTYTEKSSHDLLKHFYFEYEFHFGVGSPEDRERMQFWNVPPMYGLPFMRAIIKKFPNQWSSQGFFIKFMKAIDSRLLESPLYRDSINLQSPFEIFRRDLSLSLRHYRQNAVLRIPLIPHAIRWLKIKKSAKDKMLVLNEKELRSDYMRSNIDFNGIKENFLKIHDLRTQRRFITLDMYMSEIENRFSVE